MNQKTVILESKLYPPGRGRILFRPGVNEKLTAFRQRKLAVLCAGSGYGKTTSVVRFIKDIEVAYCWYRVSEDEQDLFLFADYLACSIQRQIDHFCHDSSTGQYVGWGPRALGAFFIDRLQETVKDDFYIILDDWHTAEPSEDVAAFVRYLIENSPKQIRFILMTQVQTALPLARFLAAEDAVLLEQQDFLFDKDDAARLFVKIHGTEQTIKRLAARAVAKTGGWAAGLCLILNSIPNSDADTAEEILEQFSGADTLFANYLNTTIFQSLDIDEKRFLTHTSILSVLDFDLCDQLLGIDYSSRMLNRFESVNMFTRQVTPGVFRYENLFRDFLLSRLTASVGENGIRDLHNRAARLYDNKGEISSALYHYRAGGSKERLARLLAGHGDRMMGNGHHDYFLSHMEILPEKIVEKNPDLLLHLACIDVYRGRVHDAMVKTSRAHHLFTTCEDHEGVLKCRARMASFDFQAGDMIEAAKGFDDVLAGNPADPFLHIDALLNYAYCASYTARFEKSERTLIKAEKEIARLPSGDKRDLIQEALFFHKMVLCQHKGEFLQALVYTQKDVSTIRMKVAQSQQHAWTLYHLGRFEQGLESALGALEFLERHHIDDQFIAAWSRVASSINLMGLGRLEQALEMLNLADVAFSDMNFAWGKGFVSWILSRIFFRTHQMEQALEKGWHSLETVKDMGLVIPEYAMVTAMIKPLFMMGRTGEADKQIKLIEQRSDFTRAMSSPWLKAQYLAVLTLNRYFSGDHKDGKMALDQFLQICAENRYDINELFENELFIRLKNASSHFRNSSGCKTLAEYFRERLTGLYSLNVSFFGKFRVKRGPDLIPDSAWNNRKATYLFQYLILHRKEGFAGKEVLMELLWPEEDPQKAAKRFHVTLAALRKILQPDIQRNVPSAYIQSTKDAYMIDPGAGAMIDTERFISFFNRASDKRICVQERADAALTAVDLYRADFLTEEKLQEWSRPLRRRFREMVLEMLAAVVRFYEQQQDSEKCIHYVRLYLEIDPYDEIYYQKLMILYDRSKRKGKVMETFMRCKKNITDELACDLSDDTVALYQQMMKPKN